MALAFALQPVLTLLHTPQVPSPVEQFTHSAVILALLAVTAVLAAPFFEELFFRGFLQPLLSRTFGRGRASSSPRSYSAPCTSSNIRRLAVRARHHARRHRARLCARPQRLHHPINRHARLFQLHVGHRSGRHEIRQTLMTVLTQKTIETIEWTPEGVVMIDQTRLPHEEVFVTCRNYVEVADAIRGHDHSRRAGHRCRRRHGRRASAHCNREDLEADMPVICETLAKTRPTAVNLFWAIDRMKQVYALVRISTLAEIRDRLVAEAQKVREEDIAINQAIGRHGAPLVPDGKTVLTHCNAGALATAGFGTALGVIRAAVQTGKNIDVFADETRPFLQGARLTAWELQRDGIETTLITDNMAGHFLKSGRIGCVVVGADRIAANGDVANKIGTYSVAVLAKENNVPFYVAAPISTLDLTLHSGDEIPIEERAAEEVTHVQGVHMRSGWN